ncbi:MAG: hypothetical protein ACKVQK_20450 [Burkholderiales bacterium]
MNLSKFAALVFVSAAVLGCDGKTPQSEAAKNVGSAPKQTVDKVVNEANKAIEQGEARTRDAIDGTK